jgi:hypothetical protein
MAFEGQGGRMTLRLQCVGSARALLRGLGTWSARASRMATLAEVFDTCDLALEVRLRGRCVGTLSRSSRPTWLSRLLALGSMQIRMRDVVAARLGRD